MTEVEVETYQVNDQDFAAACAHASYFSRRRCFKKMRKVIYRVTSLVETKGKWLPQIERRPPKDVEEYVKNWVLLNKDKGQGPGYPTDEMLNDYQQEHQS